MGDVGGLRELIDWAAETGFRLVQILPINETGADNSPYMAVSSAAIEPRTIEITPERVPGLTREAIEEVLAKVNVAELRKGPVAYSLVKPLKLELLKRAFDNFSKTDLARNTRQARAFRAWVAEQVDWIEGYGLFRVLMDENGVNERVGPVAGAAADTLGGAGVARAATGHHTQANRKAGAFLQMGAVGGIPAMGGGGRVRAGARGLR